MTERAEASRQCPSDVTCADNTYVHFLLLSLGLYIREATRLPRMGSRLTAILWWVPTSCGSLVTIEKDLRPTTFSQMTNYGHGDEDACVVQSRVFVWGVTNSRQLTDRRLRA